MQKRVLSVLLALVMLFAMLPVSGFVMTAAATDGATNDDSSSTVPGALATDTTTKGAWQGKYGNDTAVLFGYGYDGAVTNEGTVRNTGYNLVVNGAAGTYYSGVNFYYGSSNLFTYTVAAGDSSALTVPDVEGAVSQAYNAYAVNGTASSDANAVAFLPAGIQYCRIQVVLNDTAEHIVSLYSNFDPPADYNVSFYLTADNATVLAQETVPASTFADGGYISFPISGTTYIYVTTDRTRTDGSYMNKMCGINAIFLDTLAAPADLVVESMSSDGTEAAVRWDGDSMIAGSQVHIERKLPADSAWTSIATVDAKSDSYTDAGLTAGTTYEYRVSTVYGDEVIISDTVYSYTPAPMVASYVGMGSITGGDWVGKVGQDGYVLPFYTVWEYWSTHYTGYPDTDISTVIDGERFSKTTSGCNGWSLQQDAEGNYVSSLVSLDSDWISLSQEDGGNNGYTLSVSESDVRFKTTTDARALQDPRDPTNRYYTYIRSGGDLYYKFTVTDDKWHYVTLYTTSYGTSNGKDATLQICNDADTVLSQHTVTQAELTEGVYTTFKVKGSFKLKVTGTNLRFLNGIFFDEVPSGNALSGLEAKQSGTSAVLSWSNSGTDAVAVQRAASGSGNWKTIDTVANGTNTYTDTTAAVNTAYDYRLRTVNGILPSETTEAVSLTVVDLPAELVGTVTDAAIGGNWINKVGEAGYFLPLYLIEETYGDGSGEYQLDGNGRYKDPTTGSTMTLSSLEATHSLINLPDGISFTNHANATGYDGIAGKYFSAVTADEEPRALQDPRAGKTTRIVNYVRSSAFLSYTVEMPADKWYYVTAYVCNMDKGGVAETTVAVMDTTGTNTLAQAIVSVDNVKTGTYVTFRVKGSFMLKLTSSNYVYINGIFFDEISSNAQLSGFTAIQNGKPVELAWTYTGTNPVQVQRKASGDTEWTVLDTLAPTVAAYTDSTAQVGTTYQYRVCAVNDILPTAETSAEATVAVAELPAEFISKGSITGGNWIGKVGEAGYFLPLYLIEETYGDGTGEYQLDSNGRYKDPTTGSTMTLSSLESTHSLISLPEGVSFINHANATGYDGIAGNYFNAVTEATEPRALQDPRTNGTTRIMSYVRSGSLLSYTVEMPAEQTYYVTAYLCNLNKGGLGDITVSIMDKDGTKTLAQTFVPVAETQAGTYVTFKVKGSFVLKLTSTGYVYINGVFFDEVPEQTIADFAVAEGEANRSAQLTWTCNEQVQIECKDSETNVWTVVDTVSAGTTSYTDTDLKAGLTYTYRLATTNGILDGPYTAEKTIDIPPYQATVMTLNAQTHTVTVGEDISVSAVLKLQSTDAALAGKTVTLTLSGDPVEKGFIKSEWFNGETDTDGKISATLEGLYAGTYTLTAYFAPDDENSLMQSSAVAEITVNVEAWSGAPVLMTVSDGVAPGEYFSINGYGMNLGTPVVKVGTTLESAVTATIAQYDATDGYFIQAQLPASLSAGTYQVWVSNDGGTNWSEPIALNAARPLFISENTAWNGLTIEISGRNLLGSQYGAAEATAVRLVASNSTTYNQMVVESESNAYRIAFTVTDSTPTGVYTVEVTNDGTNWVPLSSGQTLTVVAEGKDPLDLGVAWADKFNWTSAYIDVTDAAYGATNNDTTDDTAAVQAAVNAAAAQTNGGVVYLPAGKYYVGHINVPAHVVILGHSKEDTFLYYNATDGSNMFSSHGTGQTEGYQGFARFTIRLADNNYQPDQYFSLGHSWSGAWLNNKDARTCDYFFVSEVDIDTDVLASGVAAGSRRGIGIVPITRDHFLMQDCHFVGWAAVLHSGYIRSYAMVRDCYMEFAEFLPKCEAEYTFVLNTDVNIHYETGANSHGIVVADNSHVEDCYVYGAGAGNGQNDGEAIMAEATAYLDYGKVVSADGLNIYLDGRVDALSSLQLRVCKLAIMIIDGKGMGQYRFVDLDKSGFKWNGSSWVDTYTSKLVVTEPWDVEPDATSFYTLIQIIDNVTFYQNKIEDCTKGIWFYGNVVDGVIAENVSINAEGILAQSSQVESTNRLHISYRTTIRDNDLVGVARQANRTGIYVSAQRQNGDGAYTAVAVYGMDIKGNRIYGDPSAVIHTGMNETPRHSGIILSSCEISSDPLCTSEAGEGDITNTIVQGNMLKNLSEGIYVTNCTYGVLLHSNYFEGVTTKVTKATLNNPNGPFYLLKDDTVATTTKPACDGNHSVLEWNTATSQGECVWCGETQTGTVLAASVENFSVTLGDSIDLDFFLDLSADVLADQNAYVKVTLPDMNGTTYNVKVTELDKDESSGLVLVPCATAAKEMTGIVRLQVFSGDWNSPSIERTVQDYAKKMIAYAADTESEYYQSCLAALPTVKAMLNYGTAAQLHFGYNTQNLANSILAEEEQTITSLDAEEMVTALSPYGHLTTTGSADGITFVGATLMLEGKTGLRLYFDAEDGSQINAVLSAPEGVTGVTLKDYTAKSGSSYTGYVEIQGIAAKHLGESFTVTVNDTLVIQHSPMKYGYNVQKGTYDESLDNLVSSLYTYYAAANAYFAE